MKISIITLLIILIVSILTALPLLNSGLYTMHDDQQVARLYLFDKALRSGQFPVRWVDDLGFGYGYPLFVFYPPLVYMLGELIHLLGFSFISSIKSVFFLSIFLSGISIYIFAKELWGKISGLASALFYILIPYRALDIYVRGALAEAFSFVWLPLILWSFYKLAKTNKNRYVFFSSASLALLMITHNLIFLPFMMFLCIYAAFLLIASDKKVELLYRMILSFAFAGSLSAFFWIPALMEKKYTIVDQLLLVNLANYNLHFVYPQQLWNWTWGFGGSSEGLMDGISFKIGKLHIVVALLSTLVASLLKLRIGKNTRVSQNFRNVLIFFVLFIFSAFMTTFYSKFIWDLLTPLGYLQFPWRFLTFTALFSSILAGALIYSLRLTVLKLTAIMAICVLLVVPNLKLFKPQIYRENLTDEIATSEELINWDISSSSFEYLPKGVTLKTNMAGANTVDINEEDIPKNKLKVIAGEAKINILKSTPTTTQFEATAETEANIKANIFDFPNWIVYVDNKKINHSSENTHKLILFTIPKGVHEVTIKFENTKARAIANLLTLASLIAIAIYLLKKWQIKISN